MDEGVSHVSEKPGRYTFRVSPWFFYFQKHITFH